MEIVNKKYLLLIIGLITVLVIVAVIWSTARQTPPVEINPQTVTEVVSDTEERYYMVETTDPAEFEQISEQLESEGKTAVPNGYVLRQWELQDMIETGEAHDEYADEPIDLVEEQP